MAVPDNMAMYAWPQRPAMDCLRNQYTEQITPSSATRGW